MTGTEDRNRLDDEKSPYLQQHADNPVNWQPWDDEAFDKARERDVPVFVSVGYSSCHWCHVMEEESFEDGEVAEVLNQSFVPVKVDREERPDVDRIYQTICQMVTRQGGWPLSVWLTPDGRPFYVGTYFPKESKRGRPGFVDVLEEVEDAWENRRDEVEERADEWTRRLKTEVEGGVEDTEQGGASEEAFDEDVLVTAAGQALEEADRQHGGFGKGQKFPHPSRLDVLLRAHHRTGNASFLDVAEETLDAMAEGGLYDHVGGGFHRYCTDREWVVPHFEKMLYDQAGLVSAYVDGYRALGDERYAEVVDETVEFVDRELGHPDGGFYSTLDARSPEGEGGEHEEGAFYVWTPDEVHEAVDKDTAADVFCDYYGVTEEGNFEGSNVLTVSERVDEIAEDRGMSEGNVEELLDEARDAVFKAREERPRPGRDEKVLAGWNGLMVSALSRADFVLDAGYAERAEEALGFVREKLWDAGERELRRRYKDGEAAVDGYLEDYAYLARGALDLYQATQDLEHLGFALELCRAVVERFWEDDEGALYFTPSGGESLVARPQETTDTSTPSSAGVACSVLVSVSKFCDSDERDEFEEVVEGCLRRNADDFERNPLQHATLVTAADEFRNGKLEMTITGELPDEWRRQLAETYLPDPVVTVRPDEDGIRSFLDENGLGDVPPVWEERGSEGDTRIYVCRRSCSPPLDTIQEAFDWVEKLT